MTDTAPSEQALQIARAIETILKPEAPAAATPPPAAPEIPAVPPPAAVEAATPAPGQLPEGIMTEAEVEGYERKGDRRHAGMSHAQQMESVDRYVKSAEYHIRQGR